MSKQRHHRSLGAALWVALACFVLVLGACGKRDGASQANGPAAQQEQPSTESQDSDQTGDDGPEIPGTIDGTPATMSPEAYLSAYRQIQGVVALDDGVMYQVQSSGKGSSPTAQDTVRVSYKGTLMDGTVFDQTQPGQTATFNLANTIPGWREVLPLMKEGDKWEVVIPPAQAYGETGAPPAIPPNAPLIFEITLVEVVKS